MSVRVGGFSLRIEKTNEILQVLGFAWAKPNKPETDQ